MEALKSQIEQTINIENLTLGDWLAIAKHKDNSPMWAFFAWADGVPSEVLNNLTRQEISQIAEKVDRPSGWVTKMIDERC